MVHKRDLFSQMLEVSFPLIWTNTKIELNIDKILSEENFCRVVVLSEEGDTVSERCKMSLLTK